MNFAEKSNSELPKYQNGIMEFPRLPIYVGVEIEQSAAKYQGIRCHIINPNPSERNIIRTIPENIPQEVINRSLLYTWSEGHWDQSVPWEFKLGYHHDPVVLLNRFNQVVENKPWIWHTMFHLGENNSELRCASSHLHFSLRGDINLGREFDNQKTCPYQFWAIYWNDWVELLPYILPFFAHGNRFREYCFSAKKWAMPVIDRLSPEDIVKIFAGDNVQGRMSSSNCPTHTFALGHKYYALSWNRKHGPECEGKPKKSVTIELRLCETHPYWFLPAVQKVNLMLKATLARGKSIKLKNHYEMEDHWKLVMENGIYEAMFMMKNIRFHEGRGVPGVMRENQDKTYETALDLFRAICRRFANSNKTDARELKAWKVMKMYSDFIDLGRIPSQYVWKIDELYHQLYEVEKSKENQDKWLHFGSKAVLPEGTKHADDYPVSKLIEV